jgi:hypothetical protein
MIHYKNDFVVSMIDGRALEETAASDNPGIGEIDALGDYVLAQLGEKNPKRIDRTPPQGADVVSLDSRRKKA